MESVLAAVLLCPDSADREVCPWLFGIFAPLCTLSAGHVAFRYFTWAEVLSAGSGFVGYVCFHTNHGLNTELQLNIKSMKNVKLNLPPSPYSSAFDPATEVMFLPAFVSLCGFNSSQSTKSLRLRLKWNFLVNNDTGDPRLNFCDVADYRFGCQP